MQTAFSSHSQTKAASLALLTALIFALLPPANALQSRGTTYYVDGRTGSDTFAGTSPSAAWQSLDNVNGRKFEPGDRILFRSGTAYEGQLRPRGSGEPGAPIMINRYGEGPKPRIDGGGRHRAALLLYNVEYWEVHNLEITNTGTRRGAGRRGVAVRAHNFGEAHHIYLDSLTVHDVNGSLVKGEGGGSAILWRNGGDSLKTRFVDLRIEHCHLYNTERNGITSGGYTNREEWYPSLGVVIRHNLLEGIPGDGIVPIGTDGALIEHNVMRDCPPTLPEGEAAAGIWPWSSDNTVIQYNEVSGHNAPWDAQGFDSDWNSRNTLIQYNYSHDNAGGFLLICNNGNNIGTPWNIGTTGTVVRYNVSVNDGLRKYATGRKGYFSPTFHISGPVQQTKIYNNIIFIPPKPHRNIDRTVVEMDNWGGPWPEDTWFANNIFVAQDSADFFWGESAGTRFSHNLFHGRFVNPPEDPGALFADPLFINPFEASRGLESLTGFRLRPASPAINAGTGAAGEVIRDLFGNRVAPGERTSIGVQEFPDP